LGKVSFGDGQLWGLRRLVYPALPGNEHSFLLSSKHSWTDPNHFLNAQKHRTLQGIMPGIVEAVLQAFLWRNLTPSDPIRAAIRTATPCGWV
jgi:hypothetical protein